MRVVRSRGLTFPIMAFLLVEGYRHTSSIERYAGRLLAFALVAQVPYGLFLARNFNVLFTLLIGLMILHARDRMQDRVQFWIAAAALTAVSALCDWGIVGPLMILMMQTIPERRQRIICPCSCPFWAPAYRRFRLPGLVRSGASAIRAVSARAADGRHPASAGVQRIARAPDEMVLLRVLSPAHPRARAGERAGCSRLVAWTVTGAWQSPRPSAALSRWVLHVKHSTR